MSSYVIVLEYSKKGIQTSKEKYQSTKESIVTETKKKTLHLERVESLVIYVKLLGFRYSIIATYIHTLLHSALWLDGVEIYSCIKFSIHTLRALCKA